MYKTESILGLTGSIIGAVFTVLFLFSALFLIFFFGAFEPILHTFYDNWVSSHVVTYGFNYDALASLAVPVIAVCAGIAFVIAAASVILGFVGTARLNRGDKSGGVLLIVAASLAFISVVGFIPFVLLLIGGTMSVARKPSVSAQPADSSAA